MRARLKVLFGCGLLLSCGGVSFAQQTWSSTSSAAAEEIIAPQHGPVVGEPYSAVTESETSQTLADGTHIVRKMPRSKTFRDSQGRTRMEHYMPRSLRSGDQEEGTLISVQIHDPVANVEYILNVRDQTAREITLAPPPPAGRSATITTRTVAPRADAPNTTIADLGTQEMEGLVVEGQRITRTIPTGSEGNDRPMEQVTERWISREMQIYVLIKNVSPQSGENTIRTTHIDRREPDPSLFQVPAGYTITQEEPQHLRSGVVVVPLK